MLSPPHFSCFYHYMLVSQAIFSQHSNCCSIFNERITVSCVIVYLYVYVYAYVHACIVHKTTTNL